jgi:hypothetical protein
MPIWGIRWPLPVPFQPLSSIGIVGGGQLALMLAEAAAELGISVHIQTPGAGDPAVPRAATVVQGSLDDDRATRLLADRCGAISFENEWMPLERLYPLAEKGVSFIPGLDALAPLITKRGQRQLLDQFHLPCPRWFGLEQVFAAPEPSPVGLLQSQEAPGSPLWRSASPYRPPEVEQRPTLPPGFSFPLMAKASRGGYAGKGMPIVTFDLVDDCDYVEITCSPKALGSGRWAALEIFSFPDLATIEGFVIDTVIKAGAQTCPPVVVGVGIGGTFDYAAKMAKEGTLRPIGQHHPEPMVAAMEKRLAEAVNQTGFGPMGTGGASTAMAVNVDYCAGHGFTPVAVAFNCWINRRTSARLHNDGRVEVLE